MSTWKWRKMTYPRTSEEIMITSSWYTLTIWRTWCKTFFRSRWQKLTIWSFFLKDSKDSQTLGFRWTVNYPMTIWPKRPWYDYRELQNAFVGWTKDHWGPFPKLCKQSPMRWTPAIAHRLAQALLLIRTRNLNPIFECSTPYRTNIPKIRIYPKIIIP